MKTMLLGALAAALCISCSDKNTNTSTGAGGASGGTPSTGGRQTGGASGGSSAAGGATSSGGSSTSSATVGTGGATGSGGVLATGGSAGGGAGGGTLVGGTSGTPDGSGGATSTSSGGAGGSTQASRDAGPGGAGDGGAGAAGRDAGGGSPDVGTQSLGCGKALNRPDPKKQQTMTVNGATRYYLLDVPSNTDNKTPLMLVFALHGYDMNNVAVVGLFNFTSRSGGKAITVFPQGEGPAPGDVSHWGDNVLKSTWSANEANYAFIQALMTDLESRFCIDPNRVFITGFSMGGFFTNSMACAHTDWFRAFAPVSGGGPGSCSNAGAKPPIIIHHGTADNIVELSSGEGTRDFWTQRNGCEATTTSTLTGCKSYGGCDEPVIYCVGNWDHTISSTAAANIWSFFSSFP